MTDDFFRAPKERLLAPIARRVPAAIGPVAITLVAVIPGLGAAVAAARGASLLALALWLANRFLDGLDGTLARTRDQQTDRGAYLDILMDFLVYAAIPLGLAVHADERITWIATAVLLASFYVNTISWTYLSALREARGARDARFTSVTMPGGLIEGSETIVLYAVMLAAPSSLPVLMWLMAAAAGITILQRVHWAVRYL